VIIKKIIISEISNQECWAKILENVSCNSSILQTWEYGDAKKIYYKNNIYRLKFIYNDQLVGVAQIINIKLFKLFNIYYIGRGPIFFNATINDINSEIIYSLKKFFKSKTFINIILVSPLSNNFIIKNSINLNFIKRWESLTLSLTPNLVEIKKNFSNNWRTKYMEKSLAINQRCFINRFDKIGNLLDLYYDNLCKKKGRMINKKFYKIYLKKVITSNQSPLFLEYYDSNQLEAAILIIKHGVSSTYLMGWSSEKAKKEKINQFLFWKAISLLKEDNVKFLDLGGIDSKETPGITQFKTSFGAIKYKLPKTFICI
jgi:lipid II:glycine glycyltransferase (peptidoglycan interpeptide bridge formation enzyme)